jgi:hypothetical protein
MDGRRRRALTAAGGETMGIIRTGAAVLAVAVIGLGGLAAYFLSNPDLPAPQPVQRVVHLDQGWSDAERSEYHYTSQGTLLLPLSWLQAMDQGFFSSIKLSDIPTLAGLRELTDAIVPGQPWNKAGLPIGWTVAEWPAPWDPNGPKIPKVGFNCAACHTGQINYKGTGILIEGGGAMHDAGSFQTMIAKAVLATYILPWKRHAFLDAVTAATNEPREAVEKELSGAASAVFGQLRQSVPTPLYDFEGYGRLDALQRIANTVFADDLEEPANNRRGDGAVKFPYLWDIWRFDWVQYNASVREPMIRNVGEALGVRAETNMVDHFTGAPNAEPARWDSSVNVKNLKWMEDTLERLRPPPWPAEILGQPDAALVARGQALFGTHCAACHSVKLKQTQRQMEWQMTQVPVKDIGTSPNTAVNFIEHSYSGAKLGKDQLHAADALRLVTEQVKDRQYSLMKLTPEQQAAFNGWGRENLVVADKAVYKARPLVGVWATPPYLHNGSVPTVYDLLSPERPGSFTVGSREYDPAKLGFETASFRGGQTFDTKASGNSNAGHWFADDSRAGRIGPLLPVADRMALIEYLKAATYKNYPCNDAATGAEADGAACGR